MDVIVKVEASAVNKRLAEIRKRYSGWQKIDGDMEKVGRKMVRNAKAKAPVRKGYLKKSINYKLEAKGINQYARNWVLELFVREGDKPHDPTDYARIREFGGIQYKKKKPFFMIPIGVMRGKDIMAREVIESPELFGYRATWLNKKTGLGIMFGIPRGARSIDDYDPIFIRQRRIIQPQTPEGGFLNPAADIAVQDAIAVLKKWRVNDD